MISEEMATEIFEFLVLFTNFLDFNTGRFGINSQTHRRFVNNSGDGTRRVCPA